MSQKIRDDIMEWCIVIMMVSVVALLVFLVFGFIGHFIIGEVK